MCFAVLFVFRCFVVRAFVVLLMFFFLRFVASSHVLLCRLFAFRSFVDSFHVFRVRVCALFVRFRRFAHSRYLFGSHFVVLSFYFFIACLRALLFSFIVVLFVVVAFFPLRFAPAVFFSSMFVAIVVVSVSFFRPWLFMCCVAYVVLFFFCSCFCHGFVVVLFCCSRPLRLCCSFVCVSLCCACRVVCFLSCCCDGVFLMLCCCFVIFSFLVVLIPVVCCYLLVCVFPRWFVVRAYVAFNGFLDFVVSLVWPRALSLCVVVALLARVVVLPFSCRVLLVFSFCSCCSVSRPCCIHSVLRCFFAFFFACVTFF